MADTKMGSTSCLNARRLVMGKAYSRVGYVLMTAPSIGHDHLGTTTVRASRCGRNPATTQVPPARFERTTPGLGRVPYPGSRHQVPVDTGPLARQTGA